MADPAVASRQWDTIGWSHLQYDPPGGKLGEAAAMLFADPHARSKAALNSFKKLMEPATAR